MDFGSAIKKLLSAANLKTYHLANALGYDKSYLSKWINGAKLPPARNIDELSADIANFIVRQTGPEERLVISGCFGFVKGNRKTPDPDNLAIQISALLRDSFWSSFQQANSDDFEPKATEIQLQGMDICALTDWFIKRQAKKQLAFLMVIPAEGDTEEFDRLFQLVSGLALNGRGASLDVLFDLPGFFDCPQLFAKWIFKLLSAKNGLVINFYELDPALGGRLDRGLFIMRDALISGWITEPFSGTPLHIKTTKHSIVNAYWAGAQKHISTASLLLSDNLAAWDREYFKYEAENARTYLLTSMFPLYMDSPQMDKIMSPHFSSCEKWRQNSPKYLREFRCDRSVMIYESAILNYLMDGVLSIDSLEFVKVSAEDRKEHILLLIQELESGGHLKLKLLKDNNPVLKYIDTGVSYFCSSRASYFISRNNPRLPNCFVSSGKCIDVLSLFMKEIAGMSSDYVLEGRQLTDFLRNSLDLI